MRPRRYVRPACRARATCAAGLLALAGCGSKTGLRVPDIDVQDVVDAAEDRVRPREICVEAQPDVRAPVTVQLDTDAQVAVADVLFVVDRTRSMQDEIENVRRSLRTVIVPGLVRAIPDLHLGLVTLADFPARDPRSPFVGYGDPGDTPFTLERPLSGEYTALQGAVGAVQLAQGGDPPEAQVEALYQVATGEGLGRWIPRSGGCPSVGVGYACFRPRAERVIILITDAPFHNGPNNSEPYAAAAFAPGPAPHTYAQAVAALNERLAARVIGIDVASFGDSGRQDLVRLARDTGALGQDGAPLVFSIGSSGLSEQVVQAIDRFTQEVLLNVSARAVDVDGSGGAALVTAVVPQRADPMRNVQRIAGGTFQGVVPGTRLVFGLQVDTSRIVPRDDEQRFTVRVEFLSDGRPTLGYRDVQIVVPGRSMRCDRDE